MNGGPVKFTFDNDFQAPAQAQRPKAVVAPPPPSFSADDLSAARAVAFAEGRAEGRHEAETAIAAALADAVARAGEALAGIADTLVQGEASLQADAAALGLAIARRLCPALTRDLPLADMEAMVAECLADLKDEARVIVRVAPGMIDEARPRLEAIAAAQAFPGKMITLADDELVPGDVRIEWAHGGIARDTRALASAVESAVNHFIAAQRRQSA
ncbi:MAG: FliH/SctL family protein [Zavarzinia sp.]|nr:FliH/SctL family protein [Zavarzinia sp.]